MWAKELIPLIGNRAKKRKSTYGFVLLLRLCMHKPLLNFISILKSFHQPLLQLAYSFALAMWHSIK